MDNFRQLGTTTLSATLALLLLSPSSTAQTVPGDGLYQLNDRPDFGYGFITAGMIDGPSYTNEFSFDAPGADMKMLVNGSTIHIYGTAWGGNHINAREFWEIEVMYTDAGAGDPANQNYGLWAHTTAPGAYIRKVSDPSESYFLDGYAGGFDFAISIGDEGYNEGYEGLAGFGWMNGDWTPAQVVDEFGNFSTELHSGPTDWTFTAELIPEPSSSLLMCIGGCLLLARRRRPNK